MTRLHIATRYHAFTSAQLKDVDAIKTAIATSASAQNYTGAALNGALANPGPAQMRLPQGFVIKTSSSVGSYNVTNPIVVTGTDIFGVALTGSYNLTQANGNEELNFNDGFYTISGIAVPAQNDTSGQFEFGVQDVILPYTFPCIKVRDMSGAALKVGFSGDITETVTSVAVGDEYPGLIQRVYADGTTATSVLIFVGRSHA